MGYLANKIGGGDSSFPAWARNLLIGAGALVAGLASFILLTTGGGTVPFYVGDETTDIIQTSSVADDGSGDAKLVTDYSSFTNTQSVIVNYGLCQTIYQKESGGTEDLDCDDNTATILVDGLTIEQVIDKTALITNALDFVDDLDTRELTFNKGSPTTLEVTATTDETDLIDFNQSREVIEIVTGSVSEEGSVPFVDADGRLTEDNGSLFWDDTNKRLGIGTSSPSQQLEITKSMELVDTTHANQEGIIYKEGLPFIHNFNYGDNGTVTTDGHNLFLGENTGNLTMGSTAIATYQASYNSIVGYNALSSNTTGSSNSAIGDNALSSNTTGDYNSAIGRWSLSSNTTGDYNSAIGHNALIKNLNGGANVAIGSTSLNNNSTGSNNVGIGTSSLYHSASGHFNVAIGRWAGRYISTGAALSLSQRGVFLGSNTKALINNSDNEIVIGYDAIGNGSNSVTLGSDLITKTLLKGDVGIGTTTPNSTFQVEGSMSLPYVAKTATYTITASDHTIDCTANTFTVTLPTAVGITGRIYNVKNSGSGTITIDADGTEEIDGNLTATITNPANLAFQSTGSGWIVI